MKIQYFKIIIKFGKQRDSKREREIYGKEKKKQSNKE